MYVFCHFSLKKNCFAFLVQIEGGPKERGACNEEGSDRGIHQRLLQTSPCSFSVSSYHYTRCLIQGALEAT